MEPIYKTLILTNTVSITPKELNQNISQVIVNRLRTKVEGKCLQNGYIKPGSVEIVSRTAGTLNSAHFNGNIRYNIRYKADVCHPIQNQMIDCIVGTVGKPGIQAYVEDIDKSPLYIMLAKSHHINNKYFINLKEGDHIRVKVINSEFNFCEDKIRVLAVLESNKASDAYNLTESESHSRSSLSSNKLSKKISQGLVYESESESEPESESDEEEKPTKKSSTKTNKKTKKMKSKEESESEDESEEESGKE